MVVDKSMLSRDYQVNPLKRGYSSRYKSEPGEIPTYSDVYYLYITINMNLKELGEYFGRKRDTARSWISHYGIEKSIDLIQEKMTITKIAVYGDPTYNNVQKGLDTKLDRYGKRGTGEGTKNLWANIDYERRSSIINKRKATCLARYGYDNHMKDPVFKEQFLKKLSINTSKPEKQINDFFTNSNIDYVHQYVLRYENHVKVYDWYLPQFNLLVEFDGEFWHQLDYQIANDQIKNMMAKALGYRLVRIKGEKNMDLVWELQ